MVVAVLVLLAARALSKEINFKLVNKTGFVLSRVWVAKDTGAKVWGVATDKALELPTYKRVTLSVVSGEKWNAAYEQQ